ncbi:hypothetical protein H109_03311 [Trichophyton interdigitale MR816]|uniref:Uncharacterized protein n=1 Tax=Trichophyton interdigitale (strain MR816) TaxID=1215338 RepID=A0A059JB25_TRIIM|nr:hypothetical protein H109_03311 [Trichophyton interdigitale MR816]
MRSSIDQNHIQGLLARSRTKLNAFNSPLCRLPAELLAMVTKNLGNEDDRVALGFTCSQFFYSDALKDTISNKEARFKGLCMLERNKELQYCCRGCLAVHPCEAFSSFQLSEPPLKRHCMMTLFSSPEVTLEYCFPIFPEGADVTPAGFASLIKTLNYALCPHMRANNAGVRILYVRKPGAEPHPGWIDPSTECFNCKTVVTACELPSSTPGNDGRVWLAIKVSRSIGRLYSPLEPAWLSHSFSTKLFDWDGYNKVRSKWCRDFWRENPTAYVGWEEEECLQSVPIHPYIPPIEAGYGQSRLTPSSSESLSREEQRVHRWLYWCSLIPEWMHRKFAPVYRLEISNWTGVVLNSKIMSWIALFAAVGAGIIAACAVSSELRAWHAEKEEKEEEELEERAVRIAKREAELATQSSDYFVKRRRIRDLLRELQQWEIAISQRNETSRRLAAESHRVNEEVTRAMKTISDWEEALKEREILFRLQQRRQTSIRRGVQQKRG